ncbi:MAG TPA: hypothetical protein VNN77_09455 [candidate division Zixibacteria bacterium]|nr:hypothetical protein [candidate division Zixibacteria bacterium]
MSRWLGWPERDRESLLVLARELKIGENHLRDLMDWLEEIAARDGTPVAAVLEGPALAAIRTDPRLGRADRLKRVKEEVRRLRFPRLSRVEDAIRARIRELKLSPRVTLSVAPGLEGGDLRVEFAARDAGELRAAVEKLAQACSSAAVREIFELLRGERGPEGEGQAAEGPEKDRT